MIEYKKPDRVQIPPAEITHGIFAKRGVLSVLEVGCGIGGILAQFQGMLTKVGVDNRECVLGQARAAYPHTRFILHDARRLTELFPPKSYDAVIAFDFMEHLLPEDFEPTLVQIEAIAEKFVAVWSPLGQAGMDDFNTHARDIGEPEHHLCVVTEEYFDKRGYATMVFPSYWQRYYLDRWTADGLLAIKEMEG